MSNSAVKALKDPVPMAERPQNPSTPRPERRRWSPQGLRGFLIWALVVVVCFAVPLYHLANYARRSELYSHILLIPFITTYLLWWNKRNLSLDFRASPIWAVASYLAAAALLAAALLIGGTSAGLARETGLALMTWAFLLFQLCGAFVFLGAGFVRSAALPLALLVFAAPLPRALIIPQAPAVPAGGCIVTALQYGSAEIAYWMLRLSGMPTARSGTFFSLPGFNMSVAPECSGIHSTLALFIVSLVAGYLLLNSRWSRTALVLAVLPLALLRNGLRIFTIGQLCVQVDPGMVNSAIHIHGGPLFFALSLIPFFLFLLWLRWMERRPGSKITTRLK